MAACGLPERRPDHAEAMASFALVMRSEFAAVASALGVSHLQLRVGMHSGSVVAGVVNADVPRFQLFGDTVRIAGESRARGRVNRESDAGALAARRARADGGRTAQVNTASRMESTSQPGRIQMSEPTAALLLAAGQHALEARPELVEAKGKARRPRRGGGLEPAVGGPGLRRVCGASAEAGAQRPAQGLILVCPTPGVGFDAHLLAA